MPPHISSTISVLACVWDYRRLPGWIMQVERRGLRSKPWGNISVLEVRQRGDARVQTEKGVSSQGDGKKSRRAHITSGIKCFKKRVLCQMLLRSSGKRGWRESLMTLVRTSLEQQWHQSLKWKGFWRKREVKNQFNQFKKFSCEEKQ